VAVTRLARFMMDDEVLMHIDDDAVYHRPAQSMVSRARDAREKVDVRGEGPRMRSRVCSGGSFGWFLDGAWGRWR
jgi:hypothetical protein